MPNPVVNRRLLGGLGNNLLQGLISYWAMESTSWVDFVSGNNLSSPNGGVTLTPGIIGEAASFNQSPSNSVLSVADTPGLSAGAGVSFSIQAWCQLKLGSAGAPIFAKWDGTHDDFALFIDPIVSRIFFKVNNLAGTNLVSIDSHFTLSVDGTWHQLCAGYDDANQIIWVQFDGGFRYWLPCVGVQHTAAPFTLGNFGTGGSNPYGGWMDEVAFWDRVLTPDEVNLLYNNRLANGYPFNGSVINGSSPSVVQNWVNMVVANGGSTPSGATQSALNTFVNGLSNAGLLYKMIMINPVVADSLIAAQTPLLPGNGFTNWTNHNFVAGDLTVNGIVGNGSTKYFETGINPSLLGNNNLGLSVYSFTPGANGSDYTATTPTISYFLLSKFSDNNSYAGNGPATTQIVTASPGAGFYASERTAAAVHKLYFANSSNALAQIGATDTTSFASYPNLAAYVLAGNISGSPSQFSSSRLSFVSSHLGLTLAQSTTFFGLVQAMRTSLGGGFV